MKRLISLAGSAVLVSAILIAGCGGSAPADAQQIKQLETQFVEAFTSDDPATACQYVTDATKQNCGTSAIELKELGGGQAFKAFLPHDWKGQIASAKVSITGDKATMPPLDGQPKDESLYQKVDGRWLVVATG